jgi:MoaA/NifB/PqqE/SkfB family radical SAM enzyme
MSDITAATPDVNLHGPRSFELHSRAYAQRLPIAGGLELTHRCNLACVHCYVNLPANDRPAQRRELTTDEWYRVIDQLADAGTLWLTLSGGEPLLRSDFCDIYIYAQSKGIVLNVYTNATLITERHLDMWRKYPPRMIEITQYGYTPETYDKVTDAGAQYDRFQRGLNRLRAAGVAITLKAIGMKWTRDELHDIRRYAEREGLPFRFDAVLSPRIDGGRKPLEQRLSPAEVAAIEGGDSKRTGEMADYCATRIGAPPPSDKRYQCGAGAATFVIDPYGKMHVCELSRKPGWDVLRDGFVAGVSTGFAKVLDTRREDMDGCGSCTTGVACSNCTGMAELEGIHPDGGNPYMCAVTDARNADMFGETRPMPRGLVKLRLRGEHGQQSG